VRQRLTEPSTQLRFFLTIFSALLLFPLVSFTTKAETVIQTNNSSSHVSVNNQVNTGSSKTEIKTEGNANVSVTTKVQGKTTTVTSTNEKTEVKTTDEKTGETVTKILDDGTKVNINGNTISVDTANGEKTVTVTPEAAVQAVKNTGTISDETKISVKSTEGPVVYEIEGYARKKFLGFIPVKLTRVIDYSADSRTVSSVYRSFWTRVLDRLSF